MRKRPEALFLVGSLQFCDSYVMGEQEIARGAETMVMGRKWLGAQLRRPSEAAPCLQGCGFLWGGFCMLPAPLEHRSSACHVHQKR